MPFVTRAIHGTLEVIEKTMDNYSFYKGLYDRELARRKDLDSALSVPVAVTSLLIGLITYLISNNDFELSDWSSYVPTSLIILSSITVFSSILYLAKSSNNLFRGYKYMNFPLSKDIRKYQIQLKNSKGTESASVRFQNEIIDKMNNYTDHHTNLNDKRAYYLYRAKSLMIAVLFMTLIATTTLLLKKYLL